MTIAIDEAISILSEHAYGGAVTLDEKFKEAERLGIEALKAVSFFNHKVLPQFKIALPGETRE
jgi:hypothetical protein